MRFPASIFTPKFAALTATITALSLAVLKLIVGILSGSVAVLASAIDSLLDVGISIFNFFALKKSEQPANSGFNYGFGKVESLASAFEGFVIFLSGLYIFYTSIQKILQTHSIHNLESSLGVMLFSFCATLFLVVFLQITLKRTNSQVIKADAMHYKIDLLSNGAILCSLGVIYVSGFEKIDAILGLLIALYIMFSAFGLVRDSVFLLLDRAIEPEILERVKDILDKAPITSYHALRTRISGNIHFLEVHLVFDDSIALLSAHKVCNAIEEQVRAINPALTWEINAHLDPYDDYEEDVVLKYY